MPSLDLAFAIPLFLLLLLSLSVHEAAHAWTADRLGDPTARLLGRITINPMAHIDWIGTVLFPLLALLSNLPLIGWAKPVPVNFRNLKAPHRDFAIVAAAGPASNLIMATLGAAVYGLAGAALPDGARDLVGSFIVLNAVLAVFNMIPVPPLDGGNVAVGLLPMGFARVIDQLRPWGFLILYALLFTGALGRYVFPLAQSVAVFLVSLFS